MFIPLFILAIENDEDRDFMTNLYTEYRKPMLRAAISILKNENDAEDIINDACIAFIRHVEQLRQFESYRLYSYIMTTVKNLSINLIDKRKRENRHSISGDNDFLENIPSNELTEMRIIQENQIDDLLKALSRLPKTELGVLEMKYLNELSNSEIAEELGMTADMVRSYLSRARKHATVILAKDGGQ